jgi:hypothetical protein
MGVRLTSPVLAAALVVVLNSPALLAAPAPETKLKGEFPAEKVRKALDKTIDVSFDNVPLKTAFEDLKDLLKVEFLVDTVTLANNGIAVDSAPVNIKLSGAKGKQVLRTIADAHNLGYAILGDKVFISTEGEAQRRQLKQRINLDLDKTPLETALKNLSRAHAVQIVVDKKAGKESQTEITMELEDIPLDIAVRLLCDHAGLKPMRLGNVLYVTSGANAKELRGEPELAPGPTGPAWNTNWQRILLPYIEGAVPIAPPGK